MCCKKVGSVCLVDLWAPLLGMHQGRGLQPLATDESGPVRNWVSQCEVSLNAMCWNHPEITLPPQSMEKLSSTKLGHGAKKLGTAALGCADLRMASVKDKCPVTERYKIALQIVLPSVPCSSFGSLHGS